MTGKNWRLVFLFGLLTAIAVVGRGGEARSESVSALAPTVSDIRIGRVGTATRVVFHISAETDFIHDVAADGRSVFVAFPHIRWTIPERYERIRGVVTGYAFTPRDRGGGSLVLSTADPVQVGNIIVSPVEGRRGVRIVLDLVDAPQHGAGEPESLFAKPRRRATQDMMPHSTRAPKAVALATFRGPAAEAPRVIAARYSQTASPVAVRTMATYAEGGRGETPVQGYEYERLLAERERRFARGVADNTPRVAPDKGWRPRVKRYDDHDTQPSDAPADRQEDFQMGPGRTTLEEQREIQELLQGRHADATAGHGGAAPKMAVDQVAMAGDAAGRDSFYVSMDFGLSPSQSFSATPQGSAFSTSTHAGFHALAAGGYAWLNGFRAEGEIAYARAGVESITVTNGGTVTGLAAGTFDGDGSASSVAVMANAAYDIDIGYWIKPFVLGGVGGAWTSLDGLSAGTISIPDARAWALAYQAGLGAFVDRDSVNLRVAYRYFATSDSSDVSNDDGHQAFTLGAQFRF